MDCAEFTLRQSIEKFIKCPEAAGKSDNRIRSLQHFSLAFRQSFRDDRSGQVVPEQFFRQTPGEDANHAAMTPEKARALVEQFREEA